MFLYNVHSKEFKKRTEAEFFKDYVKCFLCIQIGKIKKVCTQQLKFIHAVLEDFSIDKENFKQIAATTLLELYSELNDTDFSKMHEWLSWVDDLQEMKISIKSFDSLYEEYDTEYRDFYILIGREIKGNVVLDKSITRANYRVSVQMFEALARTILKVANKRNKSVDDIKKEDWHSVMPYIDGIIHYEQTEKQRLKRLKDIKFEYVAFKETKIEYGAGCDEEIEDIRVDKPKAVNLSKPTTTAKKGSASSTTKKQTAKKADGSIIKKPSATTKKSTKGASEIKIKSLTKPTTQKSTPKKEVDNMANRLKKEKRVELVFEDMEDIAVEPVTASKKTTIKAKSKSKIHPTFAEYLQDFDAVADDAVFDNKYFADKIDNRD